MIIPNVVTDRHGNFYVPIEQYRYVANMLMDVLSGVEEAEPEEDRWWEMTFESEHTLSRDKSERSDWFC